MDPIALRYLGGWLRTTSAMFAGKRPKTGTPSAANHKRVRAVSRSWFV
jgi:hypothetical protein